MSEIHEQFESIVPLAPVETKRASEVIFDQILELIVSGVLKPGDRLPSEKQLMDMLKRSRPTVREALRMLERAGYIKTIPGSNGAIIQKPDTRNVGESMEHLMRANQVSPDEMLEYREVNDILIARWAALRHTQEDIDAIHQLLQTAESVIDNYAEFIKYDPEFHALVAKTARNQVAEILALVLGNTITSTVLNRMNQLSDQERLSMCRRILSQHRKICDAIASGDPALAERATLLHLRQLDHDLLSGLPLCDEELKLP